MPSLTIDNQPITVTPNTTVLDAAQQLGIAIPTLCFLTGNAPCTSCYVCVVKINGQERLQPACATRVADGMVVESETEAVHAARRTALELLLGDHLGDCVGPCQTGCPAHADVPNMIRRLAAGQPREALIIAKAQLALPAILGYLCHASCEKACRRAQVDSPLAICRLQRHAAEMDLASADPYLPPCRPASGKRVAIVGGGPAGLAAAYYLLQLGHACTLFDDHELPGGALQYAVPDTRLPRAILTAEIGLIQRLGMEFRGGVCIGVNIILEELRAQFDAVLLAVGAEGKGNITAACERTEHGVKADVHLLRTSLPGVFVAGAAHTPTQHAVRAVADGRVAALAIAHGLSGEPVVRDSRHPYSVHIGRLSAEELTDYASGAGTAPRLDSSTSPTLTVEQVANETARCLHCDCRKLSACKLRDQAIAYGADLLKFRGERRRFTWDTSHPAVIYEPGKCIACGLCVQITERLREPLGLTFIDRGFTLRMAVPFAGKLADGLQRAAAECVEACPTGALAWKDER